MSNPLLEELRQSRIQDSLNNKSAASIEAKTAEARANVGNRLQEKLEYADRLDRAGVASSASIANAVTGNINPRATPSDLLMGGSFGSGLERFTTSSVTSGVGLTITGVGELMDAVPDRIADTGASEAVRNAGRFVQDVAEQGFEGLSSATQEEMENSQPTGELFSPSTWSLGENASASGVGMQILRSVLENVPQLALTGGASTVARGVAAGAGMSAAQIAGSQGQEAREYFDSLSHEEFLENSKMYADLINEGADEDLAREQVTRLAANSATVAGAAIGLASGSLMGYIWRGGGANLVGGGVTRRAGTNIAAASGIEGMQDYSEVVAARVATNLAVGAQRNTQEDTFASLVIGAPAGGLMGSASSIGDARQQLDQERVDELRTYVGDLTSALSESASPDALVPFLDPKSEKFNPSQAATVIFKTIADPKSDETSRMTAEMAADSLIQAIEKDIANKQKALDSEKMNPLAKRKQRTAIEARKAELESISSINESFKKTETLSKDEVFAEFNKENLSAEERTVLKDTIYKMALRDPNSFTTQEIESLMNSPVRLNNDQMRYMRVLSEAQQARSSLAPVQQGILTGSPGFVGLNTHLDNASKAVKNGNTDAINKTVSDVSRLNQSHASKANAISEAYSAFEQSGVPHHIRRNQDGTWEAFEGALEPEQRKRLGALNIEESNQGLSLVENIAAESEAISKTLGQITAMRDGGLGTPTEQQNRADAQVRRANAEVSTEAGASNEQSQEAPQTTEAEPASEETAEPLQTTETTTENEVISPEPEVTENELQTETTRQETQPESEATSQEEVLSDAEESSETIETDDTSITSDEFIEIKTQEDLRKGNLLAGRVTKRKGKSRNLPLARVTDVINSWKNRLSEAFTGVTLPEGITPEMAQAVAAFVRSADQWKDTFNGVLQTPDFKSEFSFNDLGRQLLREDGTFDPNVTAAMSYALYSAIGMQSRDKPFLTDGEINRMLGRDQNQPVSPEERKAYRNISDTRNNTVNTWGEQIIRALGLTFEDNAYSNLEARLASSLGNIVLSAAVNRGLVTIKNIPTVITPEGVEIYDSAKHDEIVNGKRIRPSSFKQNKFVEFSRDRNNVLVEESLAVKTAQESSIGILDRIINGEPSQNWPSFEKIKFTQNTARRTKEKIPSRMKKIEQKKVNQSYEADFGFVDLLNQLTEDEVVTLGGGTVIGDQLFIANTLEGIEGKNNGILREFRNLLEFLPSIRNRPFQLHDSVWSNQRTGISGAVNPLESKLVRQAIHQQSWTTTFDPSDANSPERVGFDFALAINLGVSADKLTKNNYREALKDKLNERPIKRAINAYKNSLSEGRPMTPEEKREFILGAKAGKENFASAKAIIEVAKFSLERNQPTFTTSMMAEVDGVTNGPMLAYLQLHFGTMFDKSSLLRMGGFFANSDQEVSFAEVKETGISDLYETVAQALQQSLIAHRNGLSEKASVVFDKSKGIFESYLGNLFDNKEDRPTSQGRSLVKKPIQTVFYGAGMQSASMDMANSFLDVLFSRVDEALNMPNATAEEKASAIFAIQQDVNYLLPQDNKWKLPKNPENAIEAALKGFSTSQVNELKRRFTFVYKKPLESAINNVVGSALEQRTTIANAANMSFYLYDTIKQHMIAKRKEELRNDGIPTPILNTGEFGAPSMDLTIEDMRAINEKLKAIRPVVATYMSQVSGQPDAGLFAGRYKTEADLGGEIADATTEQIAVLRKENRVRNAPYTTRYEHMVLGRKRSGEIVNNTNEESAPGAKMLAVLTHSADSAISLLTLEKLNAQNHHDAAGIGVGQIIELANELNLNTYEVMTNWSMLGSVADTFNAQLEAINNLKSELGEETVGNLIQRAKQFFVADAKKRDPEFSLADASLFQLAYEINRAAKSADESRLTYLSNLNSLDQYAHHEGHATGEIDQRLLNLKEELVGLKEINKAGMNDEQLARLDKKIKDVQNEIRKAEKVRRRFNEIKEKAKELLTEAQGRDLDSLVAISSEIDSEFETGANIQSPEKVVPAPVKEERGTTDVLTEEAQVEKVIQGLTDRLNTQRNQVKTGEVSSNALLGMRLGQLERFINFIIRTGNVEEAARLTFPKASQENLRNLFVARANSYREATGKTAGKAEVLKGKVAQQHIKQTLLNPGLLKNQKESLLKMLNDPQSARLNIQQLANKVLKSGDAIEAVGILNRSYNGNLMTPFGLKGEPTFAADPILAGFFNQNRIVKTGQMLSALTKALKQNDTPENRVLRKVLSSLLPRIDTNMPVYAVFSDTDPDALPFNVEAVSEAYGAYDSANNYIVVKGADLINSNLTPAMLIHELLHAVTQDSINNPSTLNEAGRQALSELNALFGEVEKFLAANPELSRKFNGVTDVHELVTYGLTDAEFQQEVLLQVGLTETRIPASVHGNNPVRKFIAQVIKMIKGAVTKDLTDGVSLVVGNASIIIEQSNQSVENSLNNSFQNQSIKDGYENIQLLTVTEVMDRLANLGNKPSRNPGNLRGLLATVVTRIHGKMGAFPEASIATYSSDDRAIAKNLMNESPFASRALAQNADITIQEGFVLEQIERTLQEAFKQNLTLRQGIRRIYEQAAKAVKAEDLYDGDWNTASQNKKDEIESLRSFIFTPDSSSPNDHLAQFAAMAMVYEPLKQKLETTLVNKPKVNKPVSISQLLTDLFQLAVNFLGQLITRTNRNSTLYTSLNSMVSDLVDIEAKAKDALASQEADNLMAIEKSLLDGLGEDLRKKVSDILNSPVFAGNKSKYIAGPSKAALVLTEKSTDEILMSYEDVVNSTRTGKQNFVEEVVSEMIGGTSQNLEFYQMFRYKKAIENERRTINETHTKLIQEGFLEGALEDSAVSTGLKKALVDTDAAALLQEYTVSNIIDFINDPALLNQAIQSEIANLKGKQEDKTLGENYAKALGFYMVTGKATIRNLRKNAGLINQALENKSNEATLDRLSSLYALNYLDQETKANIKETLDAEKVRGSVNGVSLTLKVMDQLNKEAKSKLFNGSVNYQKGYSSDITNNKKSVRIATLEEGKELEQKGWSKGVPVPKDSVDKGDLMFIYTINDGGMTSRSSSIFGLTSRQRRGAIIEEIDGEGAALVNAGIVEEKRLGKIKFEPSEVTNTYVVPSYKENGTIKVFRYEMAQATKDSLLERNNDLARVIGKTASSIFDKETTKTHNELVVDALHDRFEQDKIVFPGSFIKVSGLSDDPKVRADWNTLPEEVKRYAEKKFGESAIMVQRDLYNLHFGYRQIDPTAAFELPESERTAFQNTLINSLEKIGGKKIGKRLRRSENAVKDVVSMIRDNYVIKNLGTFTTNLQSNMSVLWWYGVPMKDIATKTVEAVELATKWQRDTSELTKLRRINQIGHGTSETQARETFLENELRLNPVTELAEAGMFQTVIDDVSMVQEDQPFKSEFTKKVDGMVDQLPESVRDFGKNMFMTHDTPLYKFFHKGTTLSDFAGRYVLYQHLRNNGEKSLGKQAAMQQATEAFVDYDLPSNRWLEYGNSMGLILFTKYYLRIQKVLIKLYGEKSGRGLALNMLGQHSNFGVLTDTALTPSKIGNLTRSSVLEYPGSVASTMPFQGASFLMP